MQPERFGRPIVACTLPQKSMPRVPGVPLATTPTPHPQPLLGPSSLGATFCLPVAPKPSPFAARSLVCDGLAFAAPAPAGLAVAIGQQLSAAPVPAMQRAQLAGPCTSIATAAALRLLLAPAMALAARPLLAKPLPQPSLGKSCLACRGTLAVGARCLHLPPLALAPRPLPRLAVLPRQPVAATRMVAAAPPEVGRHPCWGVGAAVGRGTCPLQIGLGSAPTPCQRSPTPFAPKTHYKPSYWCNPFWYISLPPKPIGSLVIICWHLRALLLGLWLQFGWQVVGGGGKICSVHRAQGTNMKCACCFDPVPEGSWPRNERCKHTFCGTCIDRGGRVGTRNHPLAALGPATLLARGQMM